MHVVVGVHVRMDVIMCPCMDIIMHMFVHSCTDGEDAMVAS